MMEALRSTFDGVRAELRTDVARGDAGRAALGRYTDRVDVVLREVFVAAGGHPQPVALVALGGYGRRDLCLHSDIDLLVLFDGPIGPAEERFLRAFLNPLWDLGVMVGHQVREIDDFRRSRPTTPSSCSR